jgi:hypothetical protein
MKKSLFVIIVSLVYFLLPLSASAAMLVPTGGWLLDESTVIRTYTNFDIYRLAANHIRGYDFEGSPITNTINFVDVPFSKERTALGWRHCKSSPESKNVVAVFSTSKETVIYAWLWDGQRFNPTPTSSVTCDKSLLMD